MCILILDGSEEFYIKRYEALLKSSVNFDLIINSYTEKRGKNDSEGQLMKDVLERFGSKIEDSYLLDNSESACAVFTNLGGTSFLVTPDQNLQYWLDKEFAD